MEIIYKNTEHGIGIRIIGGIEYNGRTYKIYIREILSNGIAFADGKLSEGDRLLAINATDCSSFTRRNTINLLRDACASGSVKLLVEKYVTNIENEKKHEYLELLELEKVINVDSDDDDDDDNATYNDQENEDEDDDDENDAGSNLVNNNNGLHNLENEDDDDDETKLYDENDESDYRNGLLHPSFNKINKQHIFQGPFMNDKNHQDQYYIRTSNAAKLEQQYLLTSVSVDSNQQQLQYNELIAYAQERDSFIDEIKRLQSELTDKERNLLTCKDELYHSQQKICEYLNEIMELRSKLTIAEEAQKESMKIEQEYKQIIKVLKMNIKKNFSIVQQ